MPKTKQLTDALAEHGRRTETLNQWLSRQAEAQAEVARADQRLTEAIETEPDQAGKVMADIRAATDSLAIAERAIPVAQERQRDAARAVASAEADALQPDIDQKRAALEAHNTKTPILLAALVDHTGTEYVVRDVAQAMRDAGVFEYTVPLPKAARLRRALQPVERAQAILRAAAAGQSIRAVADGLTLADLPSCLHPRTGILPAGEFEDAVQRDEEEERAQAERSAQQARLDGLLKNFPGVSAEVILEGQRPDRAAVDRLLWTHKIDEKDRDVIMEVADLGGYKAAQSAAQVAGQSSAA